MPPRALVLRGYALFCYRLKLGGLYHLWNRRALLRSKWARETHDNLYHIPPYTE